jgi:pimeloyl-ACP methyl ester carboxylesterase
VWQEGLVFRRPGSVPLLVVPIIVGASILLGAPRETRFPDWLRPCRPIDPDVAALCGRFPVWEERGAREGPKIELSVVVVPATGPLLLPDPVFYLAGGPGASATRAAPAIVRMLKRLRGQRDIVFVDVRGTGGSHALGCRAPPADAPLQTFFDDFLPEAFVRDCLERQQARVALYSNKSAMADLDEVRVALGYDRINLLGISGGTRAAQVYLRNHPEAVRSVVLKGVVPMDMENPLPHARRLEVAMEGLLDGCRAEPGCRSLFPDLEADWERSQLAFRKGPIFVEMEDRRTERTETVRISRGVFADGVRQMLYDLSGARLLPAIIQAAGRGDFSPFALREIERKRASVQALSFGAFLSSTCAEDLRFVTEEDIARETAGTFLGDYRVRRQIAACEVWGYGEEVGAAFQEPVRSDVPALLISGAYDPVTGPAGAEGAATLLKRARHVVFPNQGHDSTNPACESALIAEFIRAGSAEALDLTCVGETRRPAFVPVGS